MTTPHPELGRRVERNTNDIEAIYEILAQHGEKLDRILDEHGRRFAAVEARLDEHSAKFDEHSAKLDEHSAKLDEILRRLPEAS